MEESLSELRNELNKLLLIENMCKDANFKKLQHVSKLWTQQKEEEKCVTDIKVE